MELKSRIKMTQSERFINERKEYWQQLELILKKIKRKGYPGLTRQESLDFPNLYRKICTDSEIALTLALSPDTLAYINNLLLHSHSTLYSAPKYDLKNLLRFFNVHFPVAFLKNWQPLAVVFGLFFGLGFLSFILIYQNPEWAEMTIPRYLIEMMKNSYAEEIERSVFKNIEFTAYYIFNNVSIAFRIFSLGIAYGLYPIYETARQAVIIGSVLGVVASAGYGQNLLTFIMAHSSFELLGIWLSGGAGLSLGLSLIIAKEEKRSRVLVKKARQVLPLILAAGFFIFLAAFIEGFVSASPVAFWIKSVIALLSAAIILYFCCRVIILKIYKKLIFKFRSRYANKHTPYH